jgi:hypothetical protein
MTSPCSPAFSSTHRVGNGVLCSTPHLGPTTEPTRTTRLAQLYETVIPIANDTYRGTTRRVDLADLSGRQGEHSDLSLTG